MELTATNTNFTSHAHPLPCQPTPREHQIRAMVARIPITVDLRGLMFGRHSSVSAVLTPKVRRGPYNENVNPNHLDVVECWKGLSHTQALELAMWYQFLHESLHNEVKDSLTQGIVKHLLARSEPIEEVYFVAHILEYLRSKPRRIIDVHFVDVIDSMMSMFHDQFPNESASIASIWSSFSGGLSRFLHKFLRLQDCFYHSAEGPCLDINFNFQFANWVLKASGDVMWQPPCVQFLHVPTIRASGETYRITPFVWQEVVGPTKSPGCDGSGGYVERVEYEILRSRATFTWDPVKRCFNTVIWNPSGRLRTIETIILARVTTSFPDHTAFERQSRWSMKLDVTPSHQPSHAFSALRENSLKASTVFSGEGTVVRSPQKRKVSKPEVIIAETAAKRRCEDGRPLGNDLYEAFSQEMVQYVRRNEPVEMQCDSGFSSLPPSPVVSKRGGLQQEDIMHNYHEFADRRLFKDAGLITSPVSDGERRAYESIFMGDSDERSSSSEDERESGTDSVPSLGTQVIVNTAAQRSREIAETVDPRSHGISPKLSTSSDGDEDASHRVLSTQFDLYEDSLGGSTVCDEAEQPQAHFRGGGYQERPPHHFGYYDYKDDDDPHPHLPHPDWAENDRVVVTTTTTTQSAPITTVTRTVPSTLVTVTAAAQPATRVPRITLPSLATVQNAEATFQANNGLAAHEDDGILPENRINIPASRFRRAQIRQLSCDLENVYMRRNERRIAREQAQTSAPTAATTISENREGFPRHDGLSRPRALSEEEAASLHGIPEQWPDSSRQVDGSDEVDGKPVQIFTLRPYHWEYAQHQVDEFM
ncbi:hypothetical protein E8E11_011717 [Didymella keratinophila]|nr:hypothetical protein E8E11_011717 [Didymella keratinophila]